MSKRGRFIATAVLCAVLVAAAGALSLATREAEVRAQTPPTPCACSRPTPVGADEVTAIPGQSQPRYGITHCQCGAATCVSQVAYGSVGISQLYCVK
jgi:hypothetical protein